MGHPGLGQGIRIHRRVRASKGRPQDRGRGIAVTRDTFELPQAAPARLPFLAATAGSSCTAVEIVPSAPTHPPLPTEAGRWAGGRGGDGRLLLSRHPAADIGERVTTAVNVQPTRAAIGTTPTNLRPSPPATARASRGAPTVTKPNRPAWEAGRKEEN